VGEFVLQTERLTLRELVEEDVDALHEVLGDPETMQFYPHPFSRDETAEWIARNRLRYAQDGFGLWGMVLKEAGELIGDCGLTWQEFAGVRELEVGYHVNRRLWRRGYATEAATACRDHALGALAARRLTAIVRDTNLPSQGVARRLGMELEREADRRGMRHYLFAIERD
jgi:ribosomal-protein-alanine N-acetyltransferase